MDVSNLTLGGLRCYLASRLSAEQTPSLVVVLCHGYGASGADLLGMANALLEHDAEIAKKVVFVMPQAPLSLAPLGYSGGYAWWHLDLQRLLSNPSQETLNEFRSTCPDGIERAREMLLDAIKELSKHWNLPLARFVIGGFSQGSMLATDLCLRLKKSPALLAIFSGALICEQEWTELARECGSLRVLQSHGRFDDVLLYSEAERLRDLLRAGGANVEFIEFRGGHEIGMPVLARFTAILRELIGGESSATSAT